MPTIVTIPHAVKPDPAIKRPIPRSQKGEQGFGLIELLVVLIILAILSIMAISTFTGSKQTTNFRVGVAAAHMYSAAIDAYMVDNGQSPPQLGAANEWPDAKRGPIDRMLSNKPYMKSIPEPVSKGMVSFGSSSNSASVSMTYQRVDDYVYKITVASLQGGTPRPSCVITNGATLASGETRCE